MNVVGRMLAGGGALALATVGVVAVMRRRTRHVALPDGAPMAGAKGLQRTVRLSLGLPGSGKTYRVKREWQISKQPVYVYDPLGDWIGWVAARLEQGLPTRSIASPEELAAKLKEYSKTKHAVWIFDEADTLQPAGARTPHPTLSWAVRRGRHKGLLVEIITQFPVSLPPIAYAGATTVRCFALRGHTQIEKALMYVDSTEEILKNQRVGQYVESRLTL
jgi:hypothetical protein